MVDCGCAVCMSYLNLFSVWVVVMFCLFCHSFIRPKIVSLNLHTVYSTYVTCPVQLATCMYRLCVYISWKSKCGARWSTNRKQMHPLKSKFMIYAKSISHWQLLDKQVSSILIVSVSIDTNIIKCVSLFIIKYMHRSCKSTKYSPLAIKNRNENNVLVNVNILSCELEFYPFQKSSHVCSFWYCGFS